MNWSCKAEGRQLWKTVWIAVAASIFCCPLAWGQQFVIATVAGNGQAAYSGDGGPSTLAELNRPSAVAVDATGNIYIADEENNRIRRVASNGLITTVAGGFLSGYSGDGGPATSAELNSPTGVAVDAAGNIYIADYANYVVRRVAPDGIISTIARTGPSGVAVDNAGNLYIADWSGAIVQKVSASGTITTVAGNGIPGYSGDGGPATSAMIYFPWGVAVDGTGNLYIACEGNMAVRKVAPDGTISTVAGNGTKGYSGDGGPAINAELNQPSGVAADATGNLYVADQGNGVIRRIAPNGIITTVAVGAKGVAVDAAGDVYAADGGSIVWLLVPTARLPSLSVTVSHQGTATAGQTSVTYAVVVKNAASAGPTSGVVTVTDNVPTGLTIQSMSGTGWSCSGSTCTRSDALPGGSSYPTITVIASIASNAPLQVVNEATVSGGSSLYSQTGTDLLTLLPPSGGTPPVPLLITTVAGGGLPPTPAPALKLSLGPQYWVAVGSAGSVYLTAYNCVFKVDASGTLDRVAGVSAVDGYSGDGGLAASAQLNYPSGTVMDAAGNLYIADQSNHRVRKVAPNGLISTVAGNGSMGYSGDGGPATGAQLNYPVAVALDAGGNLYIANYGSSVVRKVAPNGTITTVAGNGTKGYTGDGGPATSAELNSIIGVAVDSTGNLYIADHGNNVIRKVTAAGTISTVAGDGKQGYAGDGGPAANAELNAPWAVTLDTAGSLYITDSGNNVIRKVNSTGTITTIAGSGTAGYSGDGGPATAASLNNPDAIAIDGAGNLYIADSGNNVDRKIAPNGTITTVAGNGGGGYSGDGGPATSAELNEPRALAVDLSGNLYIADLGNNLVRKVTTDGVITTAAGSGTAGYSGDQGPAVSAQLNSPKGVAVDAAGNLYIGDTANNRVRKVAPGGVITTVAGTGLAGYNGDGGPATSADLSGPRGLAVDSAGNLYIADGGNNVVRKVAPSGSITTVAGNGSSGYSGAGIPAIYAQLNYPTDVAVDSAGNLYIADSGNNVIREVAPSGTITTVAGTPGIGYGGDGGPATSAFLFAPYGVAVDASGNLYIADTENDFIREVTPNGIINRIAGVCNGCVVPYSYSGDGGPALNAYLSSPYSVVVDATGRVYVADLGHNAIRLLVPAASGPLLSVAITHQGTATAGQTSVTYAVVVHNAASAGATSGLVTVTDYAPAGLTVQSMSGSGWSCQGSACTRSDALLGGNSYPTITVVASIAPDSPSQVLNELTVSGGGSSASSATDLTETGSPTLSITKTHQGSFAVGLTGATYSVVVSNIGSVTTTAETVTVTETTPSGLTLISMAGSGWNCSGNTCSRNDPLGVASSYPTITVTANVASNAPLQVTNQVTVQGGGSVSGIASDPTSIAGTTLTLVSPMDGASGVSLTPTLSWNAITGATSYDVYFGPLSPPPFVTNTLESTYAPGTLASGATYYWRVVAREGSASDSSATWSFTTQSSATALSGYVISTVAGNGSQGYSGDGGPAVSAQLNGPSGVAIDGAGNLYIADAKNDVVREVSNGLISTVPGTKTEDPYGYGGTPVVAVDAKGNLYTTAGAAGGGGNQVLKISNGVASAVVGTGVGGYSGDGGPAISAQINSPYGVTLDAVGNLYIADLGNHRVREVSNGMITTVAGNGTVSASGGDSGDNGPATSAQLGGPMSLASDASGDLYIADPYAVRKVSGGTITTVADAGFPAGIAVDAGGSLYIASGMILKFSGGLITTIAGGGTSLGDNGPATSAQLSGPLGIAVDTAGNVYFSDGNRVRVLVPFGPTCTYSVNPIALTVPASGGNVIAGVQTPSFCQWAVSWDQPPAWVYSNNYGPLAVGTGSDNVTFVVSANSGAPRTFTVSVAGISVVITQQSSAPAPSFTPSGVLNAASYAIGSPVAPGSIAAVYGTFLLSAPSQATGAPLPTSLGGLSMQFSNGVEAPLFYASGGQVNLQVPWEVAGQSHVPVTAIVNGQPSAVETVALSPFAPGIFSMNGQGTGQGAILDASYRLVDASNPAVPGSTVLLIYCTGLGAVTNQPPTGSPALSDPLSWTTTNPTVTIGGVPSSNVSFYGLAPGAVGEYQVNALVPAAAATGTAVPVVISIGGITSNAVTIAVR